MSNPHGWLMDQQSMPTHVTSAEQLHSEIIEELNALLAAGNEYCTQFIGRGSEAWKSFSSEVQTAIGLTNAAFASHTDANVQVHNLMQTSIDEITTNADNTRAGTEFTKRPF